MSSLEIWITIILMSVVTFIPRLIPVLFLDKIKINDKVQKFLKLLPYTAMTCLIVPGFLTVDSERWYIGFAGVGVAGILSGLKCPLIISVLAAILTDFVIYLCMFGWF